MKKVFVFLLLFLIISGCGDRQDEKGDKNNATPEQFKNTMRIDLTESFQARKDSLINFYAEMKKGGYIQIAASLYRNRNIDWALAKLDSLMQNPRGDMFWMYPFITVTYAGRNVLPEKVKIKMLKLWQSYTPYRGDTENHWLMYYAALYLITQMYPSEPGSNWFTGKRYQENCKEAEEY